MAQKTWSASDILTAADMNLYASHEGGAFTTWVPAVVQSGAVTCTVNEATYAKASRLIHFWCTLTVTGSGTTANDITVSLPVAAKSGYTTNSRLGTGDVYDSSGTVYTHGHIQFATTTTVKLKNIDSANLIYIGQAFGLASGDVITLQGSYEAAS